MGEARGGTLARGQPLSNHMLGPMYQGAVAAGPRVVFEAGMSFKADTRCAPARIHLRNHRRRLVHTAMREFVVCYNFALVSMAVSRPGCMDRHRPVACEPSEGESCKQ